MSVSKENGEGKGSANSTIFQVISIILAVVCVGLAVAITILVILTYGGLIKNAGAISKCEIPPNPKSAQGLYRRSAVSSDAIPCAEISSNLMSIDKASTIDAAIAGIICSCVVNFHSCGIGGGSFINIYLKQQKVSYAIDLREVAAAAASENMYVENKDNSQYGPMAVGVFGMTSGLYDIYKKLGGSVEWAKLLEPSISLSKNGFTVSDSLQGAIDNFFSDSKYNQFPELKNTLTNSVTKKPLRSGETIKLAKLSKTLKVLAKEPYAIRNGSLTDSVLKEIGNSSGGIITEMDINNYRLKWRNPVVVTLSTGHKLYALPPPSSGSLVAFTLNVLDGYQWKDKTLSNCQDDALFYHRFIETMKFAYAKRSALGDEDFVNISSILENLTSKKYANNIQNNITDDRTHPVKYYGPDFEYPEDHGTSHFSLIGPNGDAVSATSTINTYFGSKVMGIKTGIFYNNEMDDFSTPNVTNYFNLPPSPSNFIKPFKRPMSSMSPVIIVDSNGKVVFIAGASGGSRIISSTALVATLSLLLNKNIKEAIDQPRTHHQLVPDYVMAEMNLPDTIVKSLKKRGHDVRKMPKKAIVQGIKYPNTKNDMIQCNADFRKGGLCDGF